MEKNFGLQRICTYFLFNLLIIFSIIVIRSVIIQNSYWISLLSRSVRVKHLTFLRRIHKNYESRYNRIINEWLEYVDVAISDESPSRSHEHPQRCFRICLSNSMAMRLGILRGVRLSLYYIGIKRLHTTFCFISSNNKFETWLARYRTHFFQVRRKKFKGDMVMFITAIFNSLTIFLII